MEKCVLPATTTAASVSAVAIPSTATTTAAATAASATTAAGTTAATRASSATTTAAKAAAGTPPGAAATAGTTPFARRTSLVDDNIAAHEIMSVQSLNGAIGLFVVINFHESKPAWLAGKTVTDQRDVGSGNSRLGE
jgi:hypothetical protein